jgi:monoamine oxidase
MARTPLARTLRRIFNRHRVAKQLGIPVAALRERGSTLGRRQLLGGAAAGAGALATSTLARPARASGAPSVAIVGGGIAGLSCALELQDRGIGATVYESSGRLGGRMFSNTSYWDGGQVSEWGGELIDSGHKTIKQLAHRFGLQLDKLLKAEPNGSSPTFHFFGDYYDEAQAEIDFEPVVTVLEAELAAAPYPTSYDSYTTRALELDFTSIFDWIEDNVHGGHSSPLGALLDVAYNIEYGADTTDQSSLNLIYLLAFQPGGQGFHEFGESDEALHIRGGNQQLPLAIADDLDADAVKTGWSLTRIRETPAGRYKLSFDRQGGSPTERTFDHVVLAIPFAVLRHLDYDDAGFTALKDEAIQELGRGKNGKLQLQFSERLWNEVGPWGLSNGSGYSDTGYQASWEATRAQDGDEGIMVFYSGGSVAQSQSSQAAFATASNAHVADDADNVLTQAEPVFPGLSPLWNGLATQSLPHKSSHFRSSYAYYRVGQYTSFGGYEKKRQGNVYFCGEHTSGDYQGFMEGGASEGQRAGEQVYKRISGAAEVE